MNEGISYRTVSIQCDSRRHYDESVIVTKLCFSDSEESTSSSSEDDCNETGSALQIKSDKCTTNVTEEVEEESVNNKKRAVNGVKHKLKVCKKQKLEDSGHKSSTKRSKSEGKNRRLGFTEERYNETTYFMENGLRKVYPYYFTFTTYTKGRWVGEKLLNVFASEFRAQPAEEYERCIEEGSLTVNNQKVTIDYVLKHNDLLANTVHRHEVPVTADPINIVYIDKDIVVVNKPASIPVHPCGRYRHNTVVFILAKEYNLKNLRTLHRLDRLTSGLLLFGRTSKRACLFEHQMRSRQVKKEYVCRVEGNFPDDIVVCNEPIQVVSYKIGICKVSPNGKACSTTFQKLGFNGQTSVISCKPTTGRMHQIRVHLQFLGYPIINDPLYNHCVFGPEKGKGGNFGKTDDELIKELISIHNAENWLGLDKEPAFSLADQGKPISENEPPEKQCGVNDVKNDSSGQLDVPTQVSADTKLVKNVHDTTQHCKVSVAIQTGYEPADLSFNPEKLIKDDHCSECKSVYRDPKPKDLIMFLHAWKYEGPGWSYNTELPYWAKVDWKFQD